MRHLALSGGSPVRDHPVPSWPVSHESDRASVEEVLRSGVWAYVVDTNEFGPTTVELQRQFAERHGAIYAYFVTNGSVALEIALTAAGVGPGDEVIVPPLTFVATATAVIRVGAIPVFADVDPATYCLDPAATEAAITPRTKAIIPVHLGCCLADLDAFDEIAKNHRLVLIEDCAHAVGAQWRDRGAGAVGSFGCFSLQSTKSLTAGEGGMLITSDRHLEQVCHALINCGRTRPEDTLTDIPLGWNHRATELQAALGLSQMHYLDEQMETKNRNARRLISGIEDLDFIAPVYFDDRVTKRQYYYLTLRYDTARYDEVPRDLFISALNAEGIPTHWGYTPIYRDPKFVDPSTGLVRWNPMERERHSYRGVVCPVAERAAEHEVINLPHRLLLGETHGIDQIVDAFHKLAEYRGELSEIVRDRATARHRLGAM